MTIQTELATLAAELDARLADETADRQAIAETALARIEAITRGLAAAPDAPRPGSAAAYAASHRILCAHAAGGRAAHWLEPGERCPDAPRPQAAARPIETEEQARELPAVRAVYEAFARDPGAGKMAVHCHAMLCQAIEAAGVILGAYDHRIVTWLSGWGGETAAVVAGLITRAAATPPPLADPGVLLDALGLAADELRDRAAFCDVCDGNPYCVVCQSRLSRAGGFDQAADALRGTL